MARSRLRVVLQGTYGGAIVHGRAFVIRAGSEVELNDFPPVILRGRAIMAT